jgi:SSS family solute:Na+ symporter
MLQFIDWLVIIGFLILIVGLGVSYARSSGKNLESFFLGGRNLPWWLAGLSMVATTFAADTPLAVTEIVGNNGIAGNWLWWNFLAGGMLTTFFFAKLWQRSGVLTEAEFIELRYSGPAARFLRGFKAIYLGLFMNVLIIGWVNVAMTTILKVFFEIPATEAFLWTAAVMLAVAIYSSFAGLMGIAVTDAVQFVVAMVGCILLAIFVVNSSDIGGISGLKTQVKELEPAALNLLPQISNGGDLGRTLGLSISSFICYIGILWWASWYPGAEPGGGGYIAQRMMSTRTEKDAFWATLFFQVTHYCIRPWPWVMVGLAAIVLYSVPGHIGDAELKSQVMEIKSEGMRDIIFTKDAAELTKLAKTDEKVANALPRLKKINQELKEKSAEDKALFTAMEYAREPRYGFVFAMRDYLPAGLLGLLLVAFFAAYMSTISTQLNWGAGYLVNDLYKRFIKPDETDAHYVMISRLATILLGIVGMIVSAFISSISGAWGFIMQCGGGLGLVLILRWYWWRINAWSELAAMIAPVLISIPFFILETPFEDALPITVLFTTITWLLVTIFSAPTEQATLARFYKQVRPMGDWPESIGKPNNKALRHVAFQWLTAIIFTYCVLFMIGNMVLLQWGNAGILAAVVLLSGWLLKRGIDKMDDDE